MRTSISKKLLAGALSVMMVLSLFAGVPANKAQAAASVKVTGKTAVYTGTTNTYKVVNLKKAQYVKVSVTGTAKKLVTVKKGGKKLATTKKVYGGKTITLKVANKKAAGKKYTLVVKAYKKGATKPFKTIKKNVKVYAKTTSVTLDQTEATVKVGETVTLTATKKPAKNTKTIKWTSSDETVATVADGVVTAVAAGTATIKATSGAKSATATITVEEEAKKAELVELKATKVKELTATLSATVEVKASELVVKKNDVVVTPADVKVDGTSLIITLGSKITEGTYSVTYNEKTLEVKTEDEKVVALKTVGPEFAQFSWPKDAQGRFIDPTNAVDGVAVTKGNNNEVCARIEYRALNQYDEAMNADITNVVTSFGGDVHFTAPTVKKNGIIEVYNIAAALGILGNNGKIIIVSKSGVSTTNEVTFSEEAKLAKLELKGIYNMASSAFTEAIPATKSIENFELLVKAYDQYGYEITDAAKINDQSVSVAQVLTNVTLASMVNGKLKNVATESVDDVDYYALKLTSSDAANTAKAGTVQFIVVGDRFGTVMNETIKVEQVNLLKSFTMTAPEKIYNHDANEIPFEALDTTGKPVTSYKVLKDLVEFTGTGDDAFRFEKNTDGSAKLMYTPGVVEATTYTSTGNKQSTVRPVTVTANKKYSAADTVVTTKTFTVFQAKIPYSIIKYTGSLGTEYNNIYLKKSNFVCEDQYGNTLTTKDACYSDIDIIYYYGALTNGYQKVGTSAKRAAFNAKNIDNSKDDYEQYEKITYNKGDKFYAVLATGEYYVSDGTNANHTAHTKGDANNANNEFELTKADITLTFKKVDSMYATNLTATWHTPSWLGDTLYVGYDQEHSGVNASYFSVTGVVNGVKVSIPSSRVTVKSDSYKKIGYDKRLTEVGTANVVLTVLLKDDEGEEYTEDVEASYKYSNAPTQLAGVISMAEYEDVTARTLAYNKLTNSNLCDEFYAYDQYGFEYDTNKTIEISLGRNSDVLEVKSNNTKNTYVDYAPAAVLMNGYAEATLTCTLSDGQSASEKLVIPYGAYEEDDEDQLAANADVLEVAQKYMALDANSDKVFAASDFGTLSNGSIYSFGALTDIAPIDGTTSIKALTNTSNVEGTVVVTATKNAKTASVTLKVKMTFDSANANKIKNITITADDTIKGATEDKENIDADAKILKKNMLTFAGQVGTVELAETCENGTKVTWAVTNIDSVTTVPFASGKSSQVLTVNCARAGQKDTLVATLKLGSETRTLNFTVTTEAGNAFTVTDKDAEDAAAAAAAQRKIDDAIDALTNGFSATVTGLVWTLPTAPAGLTYTWGDTLAGANASDFTKSATNVEYTGADMGEAASKVATLDVTVKDSGNLGTAKTVQFTITATDGNTQPDKSDITVTVRGSEQ